MIVFLGVVLAGGSKTTTGLQILFLGGVERQHLLRGVPKNNNGAAVLVSRMC